MNNLPPNFDFGKIFNLTKSEIKILESISMIAKSAAIISRHTEISETTISYTLKKLKTRGFVKSYDNGKRLHWRSNLNEIIRQIKNLPLPSRKNSTR